MTAETELSTPPQFLLDESQPSILEEISENPPFRLMTLIFMAILSITFVFLGQVALPLPDFYTQVFSKNPSTLLYTFQVPWALFVGGLLGPIYGTATVLFYLIAGLTFLPIFANGGGLSYITQPGFGYLIGMVLGAYWVGKMLETGFKNRERLDQSLSILLAGLAGILIVHLAGLLGLIGVAISGTILWSQLPHWFSVLSGSSFVYDLSAAMMALCLVRAFRLIFWYLLY